MKAFILAAGFGTRMQALTKDRPKPLLPVGGYPLIYYSLFWLYRWQIKSCVINLHYLGEQIENALKDFPHFPLHFSYETEILGTAGGIRHAMPHYLDFSDDFLVLNPDTILLPAPADDPRNLQLQKGGTAPDLSHLFLSHRHGSDATALQLEHNNRLRFVKNGPYFYMGFSLLHGSLLSDLPAEAYAALGPLWQEAAQKDRLSGQLFHGQILDAGTLSAYSQIFNDFPLPDAEINHWQSFLKGWN